MRRRLTISIVGSVAAALLVAGLGTLVLAWRGAREDARSELEREAMALASEAETMRPRTIELLRRTLRLEGAAIIRLGDVGSAELPEPLPSGLRVQLTSGELVSGVRGGVAYAGAPVMRSGRVTAAVVLTRRVAGTGRALAWFALSAIGALAASALLADRLARRLAQPLHDAEVATRRIARGDLAGRVPLERGADAEVASLARSINQMAEGLSRARGAERQFLMSISHELRTPLTSIQGFAEAISDGTAPDATAAAGVIATESRRLERLVGDLLDLARLDSRRFSLVVTDVDLAEIAGEVVAGFGPMADDLGVEVALNAPKSLVVAGDPDRLAQVVANLVENGLKFADSRVEVTVSTAARNGRTATIAVDDDGPGIAAAELPHVFDRMYRGRAATRRVGSGLGLAIVSELVGAMGGTTSAASPPSGSRTGTRLVVSLPA